MSMRMQPYSRLFHIQCYVVSPLQCHPIQVIRVQYCVANLQPVTEAMAMVPAYPDILVSKESRIK